MFDCSRMSKTLEFRKLVYRKPVSSSRTEWQPAGTNQSRVDGRCCVRRRPHSSDQLLLTWAPPNSSPGVRTLIHPVAVMDWSGLELEGGGGRQGGAGLICQVSQAITGNISWSGRSQQREQDVSSVRTHLVNKLPLVVLPLVEQTRCFKRQQERKDKEPTRRENSERHIARTL